MGYIVDSNVLIDYVANRFEMSQLKILDTIFDESLRLSIITKIEVLGYKGIPGEDSKMAEFISYAKIIGLEEAIVSETIQIRKSIKIKIPDAVIAATALVYDDILLTNNSADFKRITHLKLFNPYQVL